MVSLIKVLACPSVKQNTTFERFILLRSSPLLEKGIRATLLKTEGAQLMVENVVSTSDYVIYGGDLGGEKLFAADAFARQCGAQLILPEQTTEEYAKIFGVSVNVLTAEMLSMR